MERDRILSGKVAKAYKRLSFNKKIIFWNYIKLNYSKEDAILKAYNKNLEKNELNQDGKIVKIKTWFK